MAKTGKKYRAAAAKIEDRPYELSEGLQAVKDAAYAKFDETVEVHLRLGVDPRHADQMVRGTIVLPHGTGKTMRVAVIAQGEKNIPEQLVVTPREAFVVDTGNQEKRDRAGRRIQTAGEDQVLVARVVEQPYFVEVYVPDVSPGERSERHARRQLDSPIGAALHLERSQQRRQAGNVEVQLATPI